MVESSTHFICERKLKEADLGEGVERPKSCGFLFPRTVCKREITRDEAIHYVTNKRTELLTDFTSRYGRPFSAILVLKETGRHGFEFPPRAPRAPKEAARRRATPRPRRRSVRHAVASARATEKAAAATTAGAAAEAGAQARGEVRQGRAQAEGEDPQDRRLSARARASRVARKAPLPTHCVANAALRRENFRCQVPYVGGIRTRRRGGRGLRAFAPADECETRLSRAMGALKGKATLA